MNGAPAESSPSKATPVKLGLCLGALGIVFGDIGTSPLYTMKECLHYLPDVNKTEGVLGILSLMFWALVFEVCIKYITFVMRADNRREGGIFALLALSYKNPNSEGHGVRRGLGLGVILILAGAALLFGDGVITPAISVLGAAEGFVTFNPGFEKFVVPTAVVILAALFLVQRKGTDVIGRFFGPVMMLWF